MAAIRALNGIRPLRTILKAVLDSGLRGRGGAGFPAGRKWTIASETPVTPRYVVCNAGEDEPGSFKDRVLIEHRPHLVLGRDDPRFSQPFRPIRHSLLNETYQDCYDRVSQAIHEAEAAGMSEALKMTIQRAPTVYVAGEDSRHLEVLEGKPPLPRQKPPYPARRLHGKPTVVNNVETLANVAPIVRNGADGFGIRYR